MTTEQILIIVGFIMCGAGVLAGVPKEKGGWGILAVLSLGISVFSALAEGEHKMERKLAKEVNMQQVAAKGQTVSVARIRIIHKDGKLEVVALVPGTTALAPTPMPPTNLRIK